MQCDLCGSEERLFRTWIEGTELSVCKKCAGFGKILGPVKEDIKVEEKKAAKIEKEVFPDMIEIITPSFTKKIRKKREELGLNQKEFAKKISEKESIVHKMETGEFTPSIDAAKKLEKILGIKLIEEYEEEHDKAAKGSSRELTVGDLIKIKKK